MYQNPPFEKVRKQFEINFLSKKKTQAEYQKIVRLRLVIYRIVLHRQFSADSKIQFMRLTPVLLAPRGRNPV